MISKMSGPRKELLTSVLSSKTLKCEKRVKRGCSYS